jgi:hypothetical protein
MWSAPAKVKAAVSLWLDYWLKSLRWDAHGGNALSVLRPATEGVEPAGDVS